MLLRPHLDQSQKRLSHSLGFFLIKTDPFRPVWKYPYTINTNNDSQSDFPVPFILDSNYVSLAHLKWSNNITCPELSKCRYSCCTYLLYNTKTVFLTSVFLTDGILAAMASAEELHLLRDKSQSTSSDDSFHTTLSTAPPKTQSPNSAPTQNPTLPPNLPRTSTRTRWLFLKGTTPPHSPSSKQPPKRPRTKLDRRTSRPIQHSNEPRRSQQTPTSDRSGRTSTDDRRVSRHTETDPHQPILSPSKRSLPARNVSSSAATSPLAIVTGPSGDQADDWGLDEPSSDEPLPSLSLGPRAVLQNSASNSERGPSSLRSDDVSGLLPRSRSLESLQDAQRDTLTLCAFDDAPQQNSSTRPEFAGVNDVVGVYADPAAEADDWGDDFVLDDSSLGHHSSDSPAADFPTWGDDAPPLNSQLTEPRSSLPGASGQSNTMRPAPHNAAAEVLPIADDALPKRPVPSDAFAIPKVTYSSLLMYPSVGYHASAVHPSCSKIKELFTLHSSTIRKHFDALVRESSGTIAFDQRTKLAYILSRDPDVVSLAQSNVDLSSDVLLWKLELASLTQNHSERARLLLALSKLYKDTGNFQQAILIVRDAFNVLSVATQSTLSVVIATELEYESAILHRSVGALVEAGRSLRRAMSHSATLVSLKDYDPEVPASQQRGLWWQLRCKYLRAEIAYDLEELDTAVQFYSEYIMESISRMIGVTAPPDAGQGSLGEELMRYCLFSPRRLVLALWTTTLCLGDMKCFMAAADVASLTSLVSSAFGYEDTNEAASNIRARIRDIGNELRLQYDAISKTDPRNEDAKPDDLHASSVHNMSHMASAPFDYSGNNFGDIADENVEDWDTQLEQDLNITIERCCDVDAEQNFPDEILSVMNGNLFNDTQANDALVGSSSENSMSDSRLSFRRDPPGEDKQSKPSINLQRPSGRQGGQLLEAELRQYLQRVFGSMSALPSRLMYPKPTEPFKGQLMGPKDHERFLRTFVRCKDPKWCWRISHGLPVSPQWYPSAVCKLNFNIEPIEDIDLFNSDIEVLSASWSLRLLEAVWKVVRSQVAIQTKQSRVRRLILNAFSKVSASSKRTPVHGEVVRRERFCILAALLDALRLAREVVTDSGKEAVWFSRACMFLGMAAATITPAAKAAVELFQAESRAHCGVGAVVPTQVVEKCANLGRELTESENELLSDAQLDEKNQLQRRVMVPPSLRQTVVDLMHALYWRTKAGFDESSVSDSLERLLHAEVASSLFLTGSNISPVDGSAINLSKEIRILHIPKRRKTKSIDSETLVDETRRVSSSELVLELQSLWSSLPISAGVVRAKISFALAHHARVTDRNYANAERFLFDGLQSIHDISATQKFPNSFFSPVIQVSPVSVVSSPLAGAILSAYGSITSSHSKYRYGIAALEATCDAVHVRNSDKQTYRASVFDVVEVALQNNDWRRSLSLLYGLRSQFHPKNGLRNGFLHLCVMIHHICRDAGCLDASVVPLRAFSALIYEERLRVLLQRYKRRLAKKKRTRIRRYLSGSPLPRLLPGTSVFSSRKNTLASFFEVPIMTAAIDTTIRTSASFLEAKVRVSNAISPVRSSNRGVFQRMFGAFWPIQHAVFHRSPVPQATQHRVHKKSVQSGAGLESLAKPEQYTKPRAKGVTHEQSSAPKPAPVRENLIDTEYEQEQRELLRIEAEQEAVADSDRCRVELLRVETDYAQGNHAGADQRCRGLLEMSIPPEAKCKVLEVMTRIRLKRREITRCLELIEQLERQYENTEMNRRPPEKEPEFPHRTSIFGHHEADKGSRTERKPEFFFPQVTFLRLRALIHAGRLDDALKIAEKAIKLCKESSFWDRGRLHYLRGKILHGMSSTAAPIFRREAEVSGGRADSALESTPMMTEQTMSEFETASQFFEAAGDELSVAKSDFNWARTCIDYLFRQVVLQEGAGGGVSLREASKLVNRRIIFAEVQQVVYNVLNVASHANLPLLLIDAMAALAEVKCIGGHPPSSWSTWVLEGWKLFSRLFTDAEDMTVVLNSLAPVSTLMRLRNLCGRLVRLVMCNENIVGVGEMNKHLRLFEAYVKLNSSIDQKMNLASNAHPQTTTNNSPNGDHKDDGVNDSSADLKKNAQNAVTESFVRKETLRQSGAGKSLLRINLSRGRSSHEKKDGYNVKEEKSQKQSETTSSESAHARPAGAFLHILGHEGIALGRQGVSLFINRPRKQVMSLVKGSGAVLVPTNFFSNSRSTPGFQSHVLGKDSELIFPFKPSLGLGAMQILDNEQENDESTFQRRSHTFSGTPRATSKPDSSYSKGTLPSRSENGDAKFRGEDDISALGNPNHSDSKQIRRKGKSNLAFADDLARPSAENLLRNSIMGPPASIARPVEQVANENELMALVKAISDELEYGRAMTNGASAMFGGSTTARVWAHMHRVKAEAKRYMHGEISMQQLHERNYEAVLSWARCIPASGKEWTVPEAIGRRLVYILFAHGVVGYYAVERGGSIDRVAFGGKQDYVSQDSAPQSLHKDGWKRMDTTLRPPTDAEKKYLSEMVRGFKWDEVWHRNRDSEIVSGLGNQVLRAPRLLLSSSSPAQKSRSRPIVLVADLSLQIIPWELFFDHVVIRSHCLLDVVRGTQEGTVQLLSEMFNNESPTAATTRPIVRYINFVPSRKEGLDLERTEEARRQQLAFQGLLRLNHMNAASLISFLDLGGFSDPTAVNAVARPTGPLSSPLSQSRKAVQVLGMRLAVNIGKRNFPLVNFLKVTGLGSATTQDLKEAAMHVQAGVNDNEEGRKDIGAYIQVFMFSYAELVDSSESVFGLRRAVPNGILMFTPAIHMKVLARHLEDEELYVEMGRASGRLHNRIFPDVVGAARVLIEYVSRFSREKRIPIVVFLGEGLMEVFPRRKNVKVGTDRKTTPAAERIVKLSNGGRMDYMN